MRQLNQPITGLDNGCILTFSFDLEYQWNKRFINGLNDGYIQIEQTVAWWRQVITWTNRSISSVRFRDIQLRVITEGIFQPSIT